MANPQVRPHLAFFPQDNGQGARDHANQSDRWLYEVEDSQLTPMVRVGEQDFYIHEPAFLRDGRVVIPTRWFMDEHKQLQAQVWTMSTICRDNWSGWVVHAYGDQVVPANSFLISMPQWQHRISTQALPPPQNIAGIYTSPDNTLLSPWSFTTPSEGNPWRHKANGARVYALPIWLYCDDTSGNQSKKWNEHNSFLFTLAGLPRQQAHQEYNIHFLCTSNSARPLEMLDGIVDQLIEAQGAGIWAYDCVTKTRVLIIPWILALLGDNPMQSEFACHIGLTGKLFCRVCKVQNANTASDAPPSEDPDPGDDDGAAHSDASTQAGAPSAKGKKKQESMQEMIDRLTRFVNPQATRTKSDTMADLERIFKHAQTAGGKTKAAALKTSSGIKDKIQDFFLDKFYAAIKGVKKLTDKQAALDRCAAGFPAQTTSPVWRIPSLDPHTDTPVEILHVILLGFVKYFWRDLIQTQLAKKQDKLDLLIARLSSFDTTGLDVHSNNLPGRIYVKYAGSLTGRDFRVIAQVTFCCYL